MKIELTPDEAIAVLETLNNRMFTWLKEANKEYIVNENKKRLIEAFETLDSHEEEVTLQEAMENEYKVYKNCANTVFGEPDEELFVITKDNIGVKHTITGNDFLCTNEKRANALCDLLNKEDF